MPYIVAINVINEFGVDNIDISNALFGEEQIIFIRKNRVTEELFQRKPNGAWYGPNGPQNTRVSAVLIAINLSPWKIAKITPVLWHNPWAKYPLPSDIWQLSQMVPDKKYNRLLKKKGKSIWQLLKLHSDWPFTNRSK